MKFSPKIVCSSHYLALYEFADNPVVEVVYGYPFDALLHVLLLLCLESQLDEDLLQLLVHKVDAELLKPVFLYYRGNKTIYSLYLNCTLLLMMYIHMY